MLRLTTHYAIPKYGLRAVAILTITTKKVNQPFIGHVYNNSSNQYFLDKYLRKKIENAESTVGLTSVNCLLFGCYMTIPYDTKFVSYKNISNPRRGIARQTLKYLTWKYTLRLYVFLL